MSGHSHAANIKRDKEKNDAKKGAAWSKMANLITIAVKTSGGITDPAKNFKLRIALDKAHDVNMPKDNIKRAIDRAGGKSGEGVELDTIIYEGYGPAGCAVVVESITDNKNRTGAEIKNLFSSAGGNLAEPGAAAHFFTRKGQITLKKTDNPDEQMLKLIDLGAEDVEENGEYFYVYVPVEQITAFKDKVGEYYPVTDTEMIMKPTNTLSLPAQDVEKIRRFVETLKNHEDIQKVFVNIQL